MKYLFLLMLPFCLFAKAPPVVLKKGMVITCPKNHEKVYKIIRTVRAGSAISVENIQHYVSKKHPVKGDGFLCNSVSMTWKGVCIHTNKGWLPVGCQEGLVVKLEFVPIVE